MSEKNSKSQTQTSTKSKPSTGSAIVSRILSHSHHASEFPEEYRHEEYHQLNKRWTNAGQGRNSFTLRILIVNIMAMTMMIFIAFHSIDYTKELVETEIKRISNESLILANGYQALHDATKNDLDANKILQDFIDAQYNKTMIFDAAGVLLYKKELSAEEKALRKPQKIPAYVEIINNLFAPSNKLPNYILKDKITHFHDLPFPALNNKKQTQDPVLEIYRGLDQHMKITLIIPLHDGANQPIGTMAVIYDKVDIEQMIMQLRANMINTILMSLLVIALLSLFLAAYIGHPLRRLALAAEAIRQGEGKRQDIPDFSDRNDEISVLSETLQAMTSALVNRLDSIESFAADVAHELKNPLTSLRSAIETATKVKDRKKQEKLFNIMLHDLERMDRLITDISRASRLDSELARERLSKININHIVSNVIKDVEQLQKHSAKHQTVTISYKAPVNEHDTFIQGNEGRLMQVFENILSNALSFAPEHSDINVNLNILSEPSCVEISIRDHGPGIASGDKKKIFNRFYTERRGKDDFGQHSGLGLSICKQIIQSHNGYIRADNHPAGGAIFTVTLPLDLT